MLLISPPIAMRSARYHKLLDQEENTERGNGGEIETVCNFDPGKISPTRARNGVFFCTK